MYGLINYLAKLCFRAKKIEVHKTVTASIEAGRKLERKKKASTKISGHLVSGFVTFNLRIK